MSAEGVGQCHCEATHKKATHGKGVGREGPGFPGGQQVAHEPVMCPRSKGSQGDLQLH